MGGRSAGAARTQLAELEAPSTGAQGVKRLDGIALHEDFAVTQEVDQLTMPEVTTEMMTR
jgi:hypothetical protein